MESAGGDVVCDKRAREGEEEEGVSADPLVRAIAAAKKRRELEEENQLKRLNDEKAQAREVAEKWRADMDMRITPIPSFGEDCHRELERFYLWDAERKERESAAAASLAATRRANAEKLEKEHPEIFELFKGERKKEGEAAAAEKKKRELPLVFFVDFRAASANNSEINDDVPVFRDAHTWAACREWYALCRDDTKIAPLSHDEHGHYGHTEYPRLNEEVEKMILKFVADWNERHPAVHITAKEFAPLHIERSPYGWWICFE